MMAHQRDYFHTTSLQSVYPIFIPSTLNLKKYAGATWPHLQIPGDFSYNTDQ